MKDLEEWPWFNPATGKFDLFYPEKPRPLPVVEDEIEFEEAS
jgi:hypothetical protein